MQDQAAIPESPESPSSDETTPFIHTVPITPLMRIRSYHQFKKKLSEEKLAQGANSTSLENHQHAETDSNLTDKSIKIKVEPGNIESNIDVDDITVKPGNIKVEPGNIKVEPGNIVVEPGNIVVKPGNIDCDITVKPGNITVEPADLNVEAGNASNQDTNVDLSCNGPVGQNTDGVKEHQCLACEMDEIVNSATGESSGANTVRVPHNHDVNMAVALDAGVSGQISRQSIAYVPPAKEGNEDRAIISEDGKKLLFPCFYCEKTFSRKDSRKRHERIHTHDRPHKCPICEKTFITTSHLKTHFLSHTGVRDYVCNFCDKAFTTSDKRNRHEKIHLKDVKMPSAPEDLQKKNDSSSQPVDVIQAEHASVEDIPNNEKPDQIEENGIVKFQCRFCPKAFPRIDSRKRHERTHTGHKPHNCSFCGHSFVTAYHKRLHERTHTKEKPFECATCNKVFSRMDSLKRHEKLH